MGTFDDLSDEEKTRALLQFLQHHQQLEQENERKQFQDSIVNSGSANSVFAGTHKSTTANSIFVTVLWAVTSSIIVFKYLMHNSSIKISYGISTSAI